MNKTAFITGGGRGIGKSIAIKLASLGMNICINDIDDPKAEEVKRECESFGVKSCTALADISDYDAVMYAVKKCNEQLGGPNILVNNAGAMFGSSFLEDFKLQEFDTVFAVNVRGLLNTVKAAVPIMREKMWGRIINATSMYGTFPQVGRGIYSASKAAVNSLTRVLAAELAPYNITVNAYAPGTVKTKMAEETLKLRAEEKLKGIPLRKFAEPEQISDLVSFLASEVSSYITGAIIPIDGGVLAVQTPSRAWEKKEAAIETV